MRTTVQAVAVWLALAAVFTAAESFGQQKESNGHWLDNTYKQDQIGSMRYQNSLIESQMLRNRTNQIIFEMRRFNQRQTDRLDRARLQGKIDGASAARAPRNSYTGPNWKWVTGKGWVRH